MDFKKDFLWGTATAATQIEGAFDEDGRGLSIWDTETSGHIAHNENCKVACDHYHKYKEDVALMNEIGVNSYRFSISWSRIIPADDGKINEKGLLFYSNLVDELLKNKIEPVVTLYHWDLPTWIYKSGGFSSDTFVSRFLQYVSVVVDRLSDRVKYWITFNEPQCFVGGGFCTGWNSPYLKEDQKTIEAITRNILIAHGMTVKYIRDHSIRKPLIGFAPTANLIEPINSSKIEIEKAYEKTFSLESGCNGAAWWSDPIILGIIPSTMKFISDEDIKIIHQPLDFYAFNIYQPDNYHDVRYQGIDMSALNWIVSKKYLYYALTFFNKRYKLPILISENGYAGNDVISNDGKVHDIQRICYLQNSINQIKEALIEGVDVIGFMIWSLMDNFEWSLGYDPRFGIIYVDYKNNNKRILKDSAFYYRKVIKTNAKDTDFEVIVR